MIGICGYLLALGDQGPTGSIFLWAYDHVPFFALMREPQKFLMLLALAFAVLFGWGVERFAWAEYFKSRFARVSMVAVVGIALPLGYTANIFGGLGGQVGLSSVPNSYQQANTLMGSGVGNVLYLPWHLYMDYPFTNGRVVSNIGSDEFSRRVISGDNVEAEDVESQSTSPRSAFLERLFEDGNSVSNFGLLIAPLGVQYVVLAKTVDWSSYEWLGEQRDLTLILDSSSLEVWRNDDYAGVGWRTPTLESVPNTSALLTMAKFDRLAGRVQVMGATGFGKSVPPPLKSEVPPMALPNYSFGIRELSPVAYRIDPGASGWVAVDAPFQRGWTFDGRAAIKSAEGTVIVRVGAKGGMLVFSPWRLVKLGYVLSAMTFLVLLCLVVLERRKQGRRRGSD
jgi:hypothetical protein